MRNRFIFKKKYRSPPQAGTILMITLILFIGMILLSMVIINKGIQPTLMEIAEVKTTEFATRGINAAVKFAEELEFEEIAKTEKDNDGNVAFMGWDSTVVNKLNRAATDRVEEFFRSMNRGEPPDYEDPLDDLHIYGDTVDELVDRDPTVVEIPIGQATGNTILANLGPKIPVNMELVGNVETDIIEEREELGINNVLLSLYIFVETDVQIVIPFTTKVKTVNTKILIDKHLVMGDVPDFYGGGDDNPSISVPKKDLQDSE